MAAHVAAGAVELAARGRGLRPRRAAVPGEQRPDDRDACSASKPRCSRSTARSDEQLAYYVAQAREVIDLSIASQQGLVEHLRELQGKQRKPPALVEGPRG